MSPAHFLPATVNMIKQPGAPDIIEVTRAQCQGRVALLGGQLLSFQPADQAEMFWQNPAICLDGSTTIRQGSPLCWPWFGVLDKNPSAVAEQFRHHQPGAPSHGLVRDRLWELEQVTESEQATQLILSTHLEEEGLLLRVRYHFSNSLGIELTTINLDDRERHLSFALHSYFAISDIDAVTTNDLDGVSYADGLDDFREQRQQGKLRFDQEVDRIYFDTPPLIRLQDDGWQRTICLESSDSHSAIVWNPWIDKSRRLSQFPDDGYRSMLCIETAKAWQDAITLPPQGEYNLTLKLSLASATSP